MFYSSLPQKRLQQNLKEMYSIDEGAVTLNKSEENDILKGKLARAIGSKETWSGKDYIKTANGWKAVGKNSGNAKSAHDFIHNTKEAHEKRGFSEKDGDIDVTGQSEKLPDFSFLKKLPEKQVEKRRDLAHQQLQKIGSKYGMKQTDVDNYSVSIKRSFDQLNEQIAQYDQELISRRK